MTESKKVFIDTAPFIYFIEKNDNNPQYFDKVKRFFKDCYNKNVTLYTSVITLEEYMVFPYRNDLQNYIDIFEELLKELSFNVVEIDEEIAKTAARIRAKYRHFKSMDALQLAVAEIMKCDLFLTNDKQLRRYDVIKCVTLDELE